MEPSVEVLGTYRVDGGKSAVKRAFELQYEGLRLSRTEKKEALRGIQELFAGLVLLEVRVMGRDDAFEVGDFKQAGSDQGPYDEAFLSDDGTSLVTRGFSVPDVEPLRVAFFLHFFNPASPLETSYGPVEVPPLQDMPRRLQELMPYEPVD